MSVIDAAQRERYLRHILLKEVGAQGQMKLLGARVLVVGAGGLGAPVIQYLAAAGVGTLGIADDDRVALSNLQRQVIYANADVGGDKVDCAARFAEALNPDVEIIPHKEKISEANARDIVSRYDLVIEGVDNFAARFVLNRACISARKPLVSAAIGQFGGQLSLFEPHAGADAPCYRCLVPEAPPREAEFSCVEEGVIGPLAGVIGAMAALEALKRLLDLGEGLNGRIMLFDGLTATSRTITLPRDPACADCGDIERRTT